MTNPRVLDMGTKFWHSDDVSRASGDSGKLHWCCVTISYLLYSLPPYSTLHCCCRRIGCRGLLYNELLLYVRATAALEMFSVYARRIVARPCRKQGRVEEV